MAATVKASQTGLVTIDQARRKKDWAKAEPAWYGLATTTKSTLKRFWRGMAIQQDTFAAICEAVGIEDWQSIADFSSTTAESDTQIEAGFLPSTYAQSTWVERSEVTATLLDKLRSPCRLLVLNGMTGIGKTALAERLLVEMQETEEPSAVRSPQKRFCRLNLEDGSIAADFSFSGAALLRSLGEEPTLEDQKDPKNLLHHILQKLRTQPYQVQIDSLERLLEGNDQEGWSEFCDPLWLDLWQQLLAGGECQSQVIVTTQDVPGQLEAIGSRYPRLWHCEPIRGLTEPEQMELFRKTGLVAIDCDASDVIPSLDAVAIDGDVPNVTPFPDSVAIDGDASNATPFPNVVGAHCDAPSATPSLDDPNPGLDGQNSALGVQQYVSTGGHSALGVQQYAPTGGRSIFAGRDGDYLRRIGKLYAGHPLVLRVIAEDIKRTGGNIERYWRQGGFAEQEAHRPAKFSRRRLQLEVKQRVSEALARLPEDALQLLCCASVYRRPVPASFWFALRPERNEAQQQATLNLLQARSFAEEDWEAESWYGADADIPLRQHNLIRSVTYERLKADPVTWQMAERQAAERWLTAYEPDPDAPGLEKLRGYLEALHHYCELEDWDKASQIYTYQIPSTNQALHWQLLIWGYYKELVAVSSKLADKITSQTKRLCLNQIGNAYYSLGNVKQSIEYYQQALNFTRQTGDRQGEGNALGNLGNAYRSLGNYRQAIDFHQQHLTITREIGDRGGEGNALGGLGNAYDSLGNYPQAIDYYQQWLTIAREIGDRQGEGKALGGLGNAYDSLGNYPQAIDFHQQNLTIAREIGDRQGEGRALGNLGIAYYRLGNYPQAIDYYQQHLTIAQEIADRLGEGTALVNWGYTLIKLEQYSDSLEQLQSSLEIFREIGDRTNESEALLRLAELHQKTGKLDRALEYCDRALQMAMELGIPLVKECEELKQQLEEDGNDR
ncbi:tetratricopeptide repeat protein [Egbenema bharatensis]|uniref:tetratricopeptide repeat protein n=1 Tax=Egbenema bharatensis TaxID=3463334 RepID=UPI003A894B63